MAWIKDINGVLVNSNHLKTIYIIYEKKYIVCGFYNEFNVCHIAEYDLKENAVALMENLYQMLNYK